MVWQTETPKRSGGFAAGLAIGLVVAVVLILALPTEDGFVLVLLWMVALAITFARRPSAGFGLLVGSVFGALFWGALLLPMMLGDRIDDSSIDHADRALAEPAERHTLAAVERVLDDPSVLRDDGFLVNNRTTHQVELTLTPEAPVVMVEPDGMQSVELDGECALVTMTETVETDVGTRQEICRGEFWQLVPYVPEPDEVKPGEAMPPPEWFDGELRATYEPAEPIRVTPDAFMVANTRDVPVSLRTLDGWELARLGPGQAAEISVAGCVRDLFAVWSPKIGPTGEELHGMCDGNGWLLTADGALEIHGDGY